MFQGQRVNQFHWIEDICCKEAGKKGERGGWESESTDMNT